jgi:hypothetical protein
MVAVLRPRWRTALAAGGRVAGRIRAYRTTTLTVSGFGSLCASAWVAWGLGAGLAAVGLALLTLEYLSGPEGGS